MVNAIVLRGFGINCNNETECALKLAGANTAQVHVNELIGGEKQLSEFQILVIPGGFSHGDDLGAGRILANQIRHSLKSEMQDFIARGNLVVGICNGFQVLVKTGFLPGNCNATLANNDSGRFEDRWVTVKSSSDNLFTKGIKSMYIPVNHGEGKFVAGEEGLRLLEKNDQVAFRYCDELLNESSCYPINPNGSLLNIAAITSKEGNVLGIMPHPEKFISRLQHPRWTRESLPDEGDGLALFRNMVEYAEKKLF
ncbi:phosphoribosylformylglycinamidine synthase I [Candidatus Woesearchaeota archaeon]|nr:phosphoribosylformylglycinamidine synthase I [Candidatus Woesearchaeota archaeon]